MFLVSGDGEMLGEAITKIQFTLVCRFDGGARAQVVCLIDNHTNDLKPVVNCQGLFYFPHWRRSFKASVVLRLKVLLVLGCLEDFICFGLLKDDQFCSQLCQSTG